MAVPFVLLLGVLIFVHELGHFMVAIWCGVRVEVFSLGFGKKIFQKKRGHTTYCLSIIPLGGYVKMFGDEPGGEVPAELQHEAFTHKKLWQRFAIVAAGPVMNLVISFVIFSLMAVIGEEQRLPILGDIPQSSKAYTLGFRSGDRVESIDGNEIRSWDNLQNAMTAGLHRPLEFEISRAGDQQKLKISATPEMAPNPNPISFDDYIGAVDGLSNTSRAAVVGVAANSLAQKLGLKTGDRIVSVNGKEVLVYRELENILLTMQNQSVKFKVERWDPNSKDEEESVQTLETEGRLGSFSSLAALGLESSDLHLAKIIDGSPAEKAGIKAGDRILMIGDVAPQVWEDVLNRVKSYTGQGGLKVKVLRDGAEISFDLVPNLSSLSTAQGLEEKRYTIGILPWIQNAIPPLGILKVSNPFAAVGRGAQRTKEVTGMIVVSFLRLFQAKISPKNIGGVIAIGQAASETFKSGIGHFLQLMGVLSINLFIINLLPIPVLDGGHLLFYTIEGLRGTPLSMRKMEMAQQVGLVLLVSLMAFSLFNDVSRHFGLW
jgi:regulator of sigma E protease